MQRRVLRLVPLFRLREGCQANIGSSSIKDVGKGYIASQRDTILGIVSWMHMRLSNYDVHHSFSTPGISSDLASHSVGRAKPSFCVYGSPAPV